MSEELANIGLPPPPYQEEITNYSKNEMVYSALLEGEDENQSQALYKEAEKQVLELGYSELVDIAKTKWNLEQDQVSQDNINNIIESPDFDNATKKLELQKYLLQSPFKSKDIKDKYMESLNDAYIVDNNLQDSDENVNKADTEVTELKINQSIKNAADTIKTPSTEEITQEDFNDRFNRLLDNWSNIKNVYKTQTISKDGTTVTDSTMIGYLPVLDDLAFLASMVYHTPDYFSELVQSWDKATNMTNLRALPVAAALEALGVEKTIFKDLFSTTDEIVNSMSENYKMSFKDIRSDIQEQRKTAFTKEVALGLDNMIKAIGIDVQDFSVIKMPFDTLGEAIDALAKSSEDPAKTALITETLLFLTLPYFIGKTIDVSKKSAYKRLRKYADKKVAERDAKQKSMDERALEKFPDEKVVEGEVISAEVPMPKSGNININSPLVTTNKINPRKGNELFISTLRDRNQDVTFGIEPTQKLLKMFDPVDNVYASTNIGPTPDATVLEQIIEAKRTEDLVSLLDPSDIHLKLKEQYIYDTLALSNRILKDSEVVEAPSLDIVASDGTNFNFGIAYRKSTTENFVDGKEVMVVYNQIKDKILSNRGAQELLPGQTLEIHEVGNRDGTFQPVEKYVDGVIPESRLLENKDTSFIIRWNEQTSFVEHYKNELTKTPEETYSSIKNPFKGLFPNLLVKIFPESGFGDIPGPTSYWFQSIGRFPELMETAYRTSMLRVEGFANQQRKIMLKNVVVRLGSHDQIMLNKVLDSAQELKMDYPSLELLDDVLPVNMSLKRKLKIQRAAWNFRFFLKSLHRYESVEAYNLYMKAGYNQQFIMKNPKSDTTSIVAVMDKYTVPPGQPKILGPAGREIGSTIDVYDLDLQHNVTATLNKQHMAETGEVWHFENDIPTIQIYRSSHAIQDLSKNNPAFKNDLVESDYVLSKKYKTMPLQTSLIPYIEGHIPRNNIDNIVIERIPRNVTRNGIRNSKYTNPRTQESLLPETMDLTLQKFLKDNELVREFMGENSAYGNVVATFANKRRANEWLQSNLSSLSKKYSNYVFVTKLSKDLDTNVRRQHYEAEAEVAMSKSLRGNLLYWETVDGPLKSTIQKSHTSGKKYMNEIALNRMEDMFVELYIKPEGKSVVIVKPNSPTLDGKKSLFPNSPDKITAKEGFKAEHQQAVALYHQITNLRLGRPNRLISRATFDLTKTWLDNIDNNKGKFLKILNKDPIIKALRSIQKSSKEIEGVFDRALTFLFIRLNPFNMALVQTPAALVNLFVYGQNAKTYNPVKVYENMYDSMRLMMMAIRMGIKEKATDKAFGDALDIYLQENVNIPNDGLPVSGYKDKLSTNDLILLLKAARDTGYLDVVNHDYMQSLFQNKMIELGEGQTSWNLTKSGVEDLTVGLFNPSNLMSRATKLSGDIFSYSEGGSRVPQSIVSLRDWQSRNPGKNWRTREALKEIFMNADKLAGSIHQHARYNYSNTTPTSLLGKFAIYLDKQREMLTNERARIGSAKEAWAVAAGWFGITGSLVYGYGGPFLLGLQQIYLALYEPEDPKSYMLDWDKFSLIDYGLEYFMTGEINEQDRLMIAEKISPYGNKDTAWGFKGQVYNLMVFSVFGEEYGKVNKGVALQMLEKIFGPKGTLPTIMGLYFNPMLSSDEKFKVTSKLILRYIPFVKNLDNLDKQLLIRDISTRTGMSIGVGGTEADIKLRTLFGITTKDTKEVYEMMEDDSKRQKMYQRLAKQSAEVFFMVHDKSATLQDIKDHTIAWATVLQNAGLAADYSQALEFIAEFETIVKRQDNTLVNTLADSEIVDIVMINLYDEGSISKLMKLSEIYKNTGDYVASEKARSRAEFMIQVNKDYKEAKAKQNKNKSFIDKFKSEGQLMLDKLNIEGKE